MKWLLVLVLVSVAFGQSAGSFTSTACDSTTVTLAGLGVNPYTKEQTTVTITVVTKENATYTLQRQTVNGAWSGTVSLTTPTASITISGKTDISVGGSQFQLGFDKIVSTTCANGPTPPTPTPPVSTVAVSTNPFGFAVVRESNTRITIGKECVPDRPCAVRFGAAVVLFAQGATIDLVGTTTASFFLYVNLNGVNISSTAGVNCTGCTSFYSQYESVPLARVDATNGVWNAYHQDFRTMLGIGPRVNPGIGLITATTGDRVSISVDDAILSVLTTMPTAACKSNTLLLTDTLNVCVEGVWVRLKRD